MEANYWHAIKTGDAAEVLILTSGTPALVRAADDHGKTGLHWAAELDNLEIANVLIDAGADIEAKSSWGASPLDWAAAMGGFTVADLLISRGAGGLTLIGYAALGKMDRVREIVEGESDLTLHRRRDAPETPDDHWPGDSAHIVGDVISDAFYAAARNGRTEVARYLLSRGADVNAKGVFGATALHWAAINGWTETIDVLLTSGAAIDLKDARFEAYPDGWAEEGGHVRLAETLRRARLAGGDTNSDT